MLTGPERHAEACRRHGEQLAERRRREAERLRSERRRRAAGAVPRAEWLREARLHERMARACVLRGGVSVRRTARAVGVSPRQVRRYREHWPAPSTATYAARAEQRQIEADLAQRAACRPWPPDRGEPAPRYRALLLLADPEAMKRTVAEVAAAVDRHPSTVHRWFAYDYAARDRIRKARRIRASHRELLRGLARIYGLPVPVLLDRMARGAL